MAKIRILAGVIDTRSGSSLYHYNLIKKLSNEGHEISVICFAAPCDLYEICNVFELGIVKASNIPIIWRFSYIVEFVFYSYKIFTVKLQPVNLVVGGEHLLLKAHKFKFRKTPFVYLPHSIVVDQEIKSYHLNVVQEKVGVALYSWIQKWALKKADYVMRFSIKASQILQDYYDIKLCNKVIVNPIGIDIPSYKKTFDIEIKKLNLLFVGRLVKSKNLIMVLRILFKLKGYNWKLNVVGDGNLRIELENFVKSEGFESRVSFHGHCTDVGSWYVKSDLLLFPSMLESFGLVILEAMSYAIPVIAMKPDGIVYNTVSSEIIENERIGFLADSEDDYYHKLEAILKSPEKLYVIGQAARKHVESNYSWRSHITKYERLIKS